MLYITLILGVTIKIMDCQDIVHGLSTHKSVLSTNCPRIVGRVRPVCCVCPGGKSVFAEGSLSSQEHRLSGICARQSFASKGELAAHPLTAFRNRQLQTEGIEVINLAGSNINSKILVLSRYRNPANHPGSTTRFRVYGQGARIQFCDLLYQK
jgi:hypothetical protein